MEKKIMIVEDSSLMIAIISNFIKKMNLEVKILEAHSGEESIDMYSKEKPDLVFMDIKMPGMDGVTALEKIKLLDSKAKVVMCTSLKETEQEERSNKAGCVAYIIKPFSRQDIIDVVEKYL